MNYFLAKKMSENIQNFVEFNKYSMGTLLSRETVKKFVEQKSEDESNLEQDLTTIIYSVIDNPMNKVKVIKDEWLDKFFHYKIFYTWNSTFALTLGKIKIFQIIIMDYYVMINYLGEWNIYSKHLFEITQLKTRNIRKIRLL